MREAVAKEEEEEEGRKYFARLAARGAACTLGCFGGHPACRGRFHLPVAEVMMMELVPPPFRRREGAPPDDDGGGPYCCFRILPANARFHFYQLFSFCAALRHFPKKGAIRNRS